jgi:hypothetical protein
MLHLDDEPFAAALDWQSLIEALKGGCRAGG